MKPLLILLLFASCLAVFSPMRSAHSALDAGDKPAASQTTDKKPLREKIMRRLNLGPKTTWELIFLAFAVALFIEMATASGRGINLSDILGRLLTTVLLALLIYKITALIEGVMNSLAMQVEGGESFWDIIIHQPEEFSESIKKEGFWNTILSGLVSGMNAIIYCIVLGLKEAIEFVQEAILTILLVVAPIVVALSLIPGFNLVPLYIMTFIGISSWSLFAAIISTIVAATVHLPETTEPIKLLLNSLFNNIVGIFALLAAPSLALVIFRGGGPTGSILTRVVGLGMTAVTSLGSTLLGGAAGLVAGKTAQDSLVPAKEFAGAWVKGSNDFYVEAQDSLRSFFKPKDLPK